MKVTYRDDGVAEYRSMQGEAIDAIAFRHYGTHEDTTELLLDANRGISSLGLVLPLDTVVVLPPLPVQPKPRSVISLWD